MIAYAVAASVPGVADATAGDQRIRAERIAHIRFHQLLVRSWRLSTWARLTRSHNRLTDLASVAGTGMIVSQHAAGLHSVSITAICGSEGRCNDFDAQFRPVRAHDQDRWASVATAVLLGVTLLPVDLIQIGNNYFVRDGHHRISVMRAFGQCDVDATVSVWRLDDEAMVPPTCTYRA